MKRKLIKISSALVCVAMLATLLSACDFQGIASKEVVKPVEVNLKTDLKDAKFSFTYGELRTVMEKDYPDKLADLFENFEEILDENEITLNYNDLVNRYGEDSDLFKAIMGLLTDEEKAMLTANSDEVLEYFVANLNSAKLAKPIVEYKESFWVDNDSIEFSQNGTETDEKVKTAAKYFSDFVTEGVADENSNRLLSGTTVQGDDLSDILYLFGSETATALTSDDVVSVISSLNEETEIYTDENDVEQTVVTDMTRTVVIVLKDGKENVEKAFSPRGKDSILEEMKKASSYFTVDDYETSYNMCKITATFNAATDEILTLSYDKNLIVNTAVTGVGSLEYLGVQDLEFKCTDNMYYHFGWSSEAE